MILSIFKKQILLVGLFMVVSLFFIYPASAQVNLGSQINSQINAGAKGAEIESTKVDPRIFVASLVQIVLGLTGVIFLMLTVAGGYWLVTARGDETKAEKASKTIRGAVIGLFVVLAAYSITTLVSRSLQQASGQSSGSLNNKSSEQEIQAGSRSNDARFIKRN